MELEEDRKRGSSGTIRQTYPGHVVRVKMRRETTGPPAKGKQEHLVLKTYFIYVLRPAILIKTVWFLQAIKSSWNSTAKLLE